MTLDADAVVIGSGLGGLSAALGLAQAGQRVLLLERHEVPGGYSQSFHVDGFRFSPGVHYVGELHEGGLVRRLFEGLGAAPDFFELNRERVDSCVLGEERFEHCAGREALTARFAARFPSEARGVAAVLETIASLHARLTSSVETHRARDFQRWSERDRFFALAPLDTLLKQWVRDPLCRAFLTVHCTNYGLPPSLAPLAVHATNQGHYLEGGFHPRGGGAGLVKSLLAPLRQRGGQVLLETGVARVLVERGRAVGVRLADGRELRSKVVVSNADPLVTWTKLVGLEHAPPAVRARLERVRWSMPAVSLFLVVDADVRALGLDSGNLWITGSDQEGLHRAANDERPWGDASPAFFLSVSTLKDPTHFDGRHHVLEVTAAIGWHVFARWAADPEGRHAPGYLALKQQLEARLLEAVERAVPGLTARVVAKTLATPLTSERYVGVTRGAQYGVEKSRDLFGPHAFPVSGELEGLALCGASTLGHGVLGAVLSGVAAASSVLEVPLSGVLTARDAKVRTWPAEDASCWPGELQAAVSRRSRD